MDEHRDTERKVVIGTIVVIFASPLVIFNFLENKLFTGIPYSNLKYICEMKTVCESYGKSRNICATAGSINECIKIKMGNANYSKISVCSTDGSVRFPSAEEVSGFQCLKASFDF